MKTPEEMAEEFAKKFYGDGEHIDFPDSQTFYVAGYKAAEEKYKSQIEELETQLENWQHLATHGDEGL